VRLLTLSTALVLISANGPAFAFQETQIAPSTQEVGDAPKKQADIDGKNDGAIELTTPSEGDKSEGGTEISIPGLGTIGKLPKLDFGLDLLYGADEKREAASAAPDEDTNDNKIMLRGTVKHRF